MTNGKTSVNKTCYDDDEAEEEGDDDDDDDDKGDESQPPWEAPCSAASPISCPDSQEAIAVLASCLLSALRLVPQAS